MKIEDQHLLRSRTWTRAIEALGAAERMAWRELDGLSSEPFPYIPTMTFAGPDLSEAHRAIAEAPLGRLGVACLIDLGVDGYLHRAEALKLYELAWFAEGDILELGTHKGLSTSILAHALADRGKGALETVDIDASTHGEARANVTSRPGGERVTFTLQDATQRLDALLAEERSFGLAFVDHWHGYQATLEAAQRVPLLLRPGGYAMFHDFYDPGNADPDHVYGVYQGVLDGFAEHPAMRFVGSAGSSAIFQRAG